MPRRSHARPAPGHRTVKGWRRPSLAGRLLVATPLLRDPNFERTTVFIAEHSPDGAVGVVLNRPSETDVAGVLPAWGSSVSSPAVVFVGGPVAQDGALALARVGGPSCPRTASSRSSTGSALLTWRATPLCSRRTLPGCGCTPVTPGGDPVSWTARSPRARGTSSTARPMTCSAADRSCSGATCSAAKVASSRSYPRSPPTRH